MALITVGRVSDFSVVVTPSARTQYPALEAVESFLTLAKKAPSAPSTAFDFLVSPDRRGLALQCLQLRRGFAKHLPLVFRPTSDIYFLAWAWDMSGLSYYPGEKADPGSCLIALKSGQLMDRGHCARTIAHPLHGAE